MKKYTKGNTLIKQNKLSVADYQRLIQETGWDVPPDTAIAAALTRSVVTFSKWVDGRVVGMVRLVGDGTIVFYIQDLVVVKTHRRQGIATALMERILQYLEEYAAPNSFIGLMSVAGLEEFYQRFGFIKRPTDKYGAGMTQVWQKRRAQ